VVVDSLKALDPKRPIREALDPKRPIREADIQRVDRHVPIDVDVRYVEHAVLQNDIDV